MTGLPNRSLYPLQLLSAYHLAFSQNACNFSVPGAGKTSIVYGAYAYLHQLPENHPKHIDRLLIVGPLSAFGPWELEYAECFGQKPNAKRLVSGISKEDKSNYLYSKHTAELTLISYASLASLEEDIGFLFGPRDKFKQMIINLIDNAIKYSGENSKVMIEALVEDERKVISIQDFGIGIPEGSIPRIFERFYRVDKARSKAIYGGTGLGLSIVKHIAISFGAEISVESQPGKGTKFKIKFPLVRKES